MRRIAIINQKGGVGKTTTVANLGAALARAGQRVLVVDFDPQANLSMYLGVEVQPGEASAYSVLCSGTPLDSAVRTTNTPGLEILPSHIDLSGAELELASTIGRETILRDSLSVWAEREARAGKPLDYILIDCPPSLGLLSVNALCAASEVLVVAQTEFFALQGLSKLLEIVDLVQARLNPELKVTGVLASIYDARLRLAREVLGELRRFFPTETFRTTIATNVRLAESPSHAQTIFEYAPESRGARDYAALAEEILANEKAAKAGPSDLEEKVQGIAEADANPRQETSPSRAEEPQPIPSATPAPVNPAPVNPPTQESSGNSPSITSVGTAQAPTTLNPSPSAFEPSVPTTAAPQVAIVPTPTATLTPDASLETEKALEWNHAGEEFIEAPPAATPEVIAEPAAEEWIVLHPPEPQVEAAPVVAFEEMQKAPEPVPLEAPIKSKPRPSMRASSWGDYMGEERSRPIWPSKTWE